MPQNVTVWVVLIVALAAVAVLMVLKGRGGSASVRGWKFRLNNTPEPKPQIDVANGIDANDAKMGNITGVKAAGAGAAGAGNADVRVAEKGKFFKSTVGDITGVDIGGKGTGKRNPE